MYEFNPYHQSLYSAKNETKKLLARHKGKCFRQLIEHQKQGLQPYAEVIELLKSLNIPVLEVDTRNSLENSALVTSFIKRYGAV